MAKMKFSTGNQKPKDEPKIQTVSDTVVISCYIASVAIVIICGIEAVKQFQLDNLWGGIVYVVLAVAGVLFSFFITRWNRRNKKQLQEKKTK